MTIFDVSEFREMIKLSAPTANFDSHFEFYYDETNNLKKFYVREEDFNYSFTANFVLGGIVLENNQIDFAPLFNGLKLQKNIKEVKFKHIASGSFIDCLKSNKLSVYLKFLLDNDILIHYSSINILYYSIVDIVDSAIVNSEITMKLDNGFSLYLKNDLYKLAKLEIESVIELFYQFEYPNIKKESVIIFIEALTSLFDKYIDTEEFHFGLESLRQILKEAKKKETLPFIMDDEDFILLKDFSQFYFRPIYTFINSNHIFDNEDSIVEIFNNIEFKNGNTKLNTYTFKDSKSDILLQISDVFVGLIGKLTNFINTSTPDDIFQIVQSLNAVQQTNLDALLDLISKSNNQNVGFLHHIDSFEEMRKMRLIHEIRGK